MRNALRAQRWCTLGTAWWVRDLKGLPSIITVIEVLVRAPSHDGMSSSPGRLLNQRRVSPLHRHGDPLARQFLPMWCGPPRDVARVNGPFDLAEPIQLAYVATRSILSCVCV